MLVSILSALGLTLEDAIVTAASAGVVLFLVIVIFLAGFRASARLDGAAMERLAAAEGVPIEAVMIDPSGRRALAKLAGGKLLVARVLGDVVGARVTAAGNASIRLKRNCVRVAFGDLGFPALEVRFNAEAPQWVQQLARG